MKKYEIKNHLIQSARNAATGATIHDINGAIGRYRQWVVNYNYWKNEAGREANANAAKLKIERHETQLRKLAQ